MTAQFIQDIDTLQYEKLGEGPCISCLRSGRPAVSGSLGSDRRWPHFGGSVARMGVHSVLALPLAVGDRVIGAINSYAYGRDAFTEHAVQLGTNSPAPQRYRCTTRSCWQVPDCAPSNCSRRCAPGQ